MENWQEKTLGVICAESGGFIQTGPFGSQLHQSDYVTEGIPVIMPKDIKDDRLELKEAAKVSPKMAEKLKKHKLKKNDIIFPRRGDLDKRALIDETTEGSLCGTGCLKIYLPEKQLSTQFLYRYLKLPSVVEWIIGQSIGATMENLNTGTLSKIPIRFPDLPTQQHIAGILSAYDELIEVNNQRIKLLEETSRQLYKEWFVRLRFPGYERTQFVKGLPEGWEVGTCHNFSDVKGGGTPATTNPIYWDGLIKFYTPTDFSDEFFCQETEKTITEIGFKNSSTKLFPKYATFITARGTVGNVNMAGEPMAMNQSCFGLIAHRKEDHFYLFLYTLDMVDFLKQVATGATFDAVTLKTFNNYLKPLPPELVLDKFSQLIDPLFNQIETLQAQNTVLRQTRDRLLPRLISGKLSVGAVAGAAAANLA